MKEILFGIVAEIEKELQNLQELRAEFEKVLGFLKERVSLIR